MVRGQRHCEACHPCVMVVRRCGLGVVNRELAGEHVDSMALFFALNGGILPRKRKKTAYFTQLSEITAILYR